MRYIFYFFTLALVFTTGMLVGNFCIPDHSTSVAAAVSAPDIASTNPAIANATEENAQQALTTLSQALSACPMVVKEEQESLFNQISLFLTLQSFQTKKALYEAEIAKNTLGTRTTSQFSKAASDYSAAKQRAEQQADALFPQAPTADSMPAENTATAPSSTTATN